MENVQQLQSLYSILIQVENIFKITFLTDLGKYIEHIKSYITHFSCVTKCSL